MGPAATTAMGILVGLIGYLAMAFIGVIAVNGANNPGIGRSEASAAAGASTQMSAAEQQRGSFQSLDLNGDGRLSLAEAAGHAEIVTRFERADRNKDGKLTAAEFERLSKLPERKPRAKKKDSRRRPQTTQPVTGG